MNTRIKAAGGRRKEKIILEHGISNHRNKAVQARIIKAASIPLDEIDKVLRSEANVLFVQSTDGTVANRKYYRLDTKRSARVPAALAVMPRIDSPNQPRTSTVGQGTMIPISQDQARFLMKRGFVVCDPACRNLLLPYPSKFEICPLHPQETCQHPVIGPLASSLLFRKGNQKADLSFSSRKPTTRGRS